MNNVSKTRVKVSVVIPTYNMGHFIEDAIQSVLTGDFKELELIVVDDGSTDDTASRLSPYVDATNHKYDPRVQFHRQGNRGKSAAVNYGFDIARGQFITVLDADDQLPVDSISARYHALKKVENPSQGFSVGGFEVFKNDETIVGKRSAPRKTDPKTLYRHFCVRYRSPFSMNATLFPRELRKEVGYLDERLKRCQDIDYSLRMLKASTTIACVNQSVYRYRKHRSSLEQRMTIRLKTIIHRSEVYWKNYQGVWALMAVVAGVSIDVGKLLYELKGNYHN